MAGSPTRRAALQILAASTFGGIPAAHAASAADSHLHALVDELLAINQRQNAMLDADPEADCGEAYQVLERRHFEIINTVAWIDADGIAGFQAKARALRFIGVYEDSPSTRDIATSLAADILRLYPVEVV